MHIMNGIRSRPRTASFGLYDLAADHIRRPPVLVDWLEPRMKEEPLAFPRCLVLWILCLWTNQSQMGCGPKPPGCGLALGKKKLVSNSPWRDNDLELPTYGDHPALNTTAIAASCGSFERPLCAKYKRFKKERK